LNGVSGKIGEMSYIMKLFRDKETGIKFQTNLEKSNVPRARKTLDDGIA